MASPRDAVLPILKSIQTNLTRLESKVDNQGEAVADMGEKIDAMQGLMHYHLGMTTEQKHQILEIQKHVRDLLNRVSTLEGNRS